MDAAVLKALPFFSELADDELGAIAHAAEEKSVAEGKDIVREGDFSYDFFVIEDGSAEVRRGDELLAQLGPGDFFGELGVLHEQLRTASVVATSRVRLITLSHWDLDRLKKRIPQVIERIEQGVAARNPG